MATATERKALSMVLSFLLTCVYCTHTSVGIACTGRARNDTRQHEPDADGMLPLSIAPFAHTKAPVRGFAAAEPKVVWRNIEYDIDVGVAVLMQTIEDSRASSLDRESALDRLGMLGAYLNGRECLTTLIAIYGTMETRNEKASILQCLSKARDPRVLPIAYDTVEKDEDAVLRLFGAIALAQWNVRRGAGALVQLCESKEVISDGRMPLVRDNAIDMFRTLGNQKNWGFPDEEVRAKVSARSLVNQEEAITLYVTEIARDRKSVV